MGENKLRWWGKRGSGGGNEMRRGKGAQVGKGSSGGGIRHGNGVQVGKEDLDGKMGL